MFGLGRLPALDILNVHEAQTDPATKQIHLCSSVLLFVHQDAVFLQPSYPQGKRRSMRPLLRRSRRHSLLNARAILLLVWLLVSACSGPSSSGSPSNPSIPPLGSNIEPSPDIPSELAGEPTPSGDREDGALLTITQIKKDLVGHRINDIDISSPDQVVDVISNQTQEQFPTDQTQMRFPANLVVEDSQTESRYQADVLLVYQHQKGNWTLQNLTTMNVVLLPEPVPSPPQTPVALGQPARVGAFTVVVHGIQQIDWHELEPGEVSSYRRGQRLLVDISLRNDTKRMVVWPTNATFTVVSSDGTALNAEYGDIQSGFAEGAVGLLPTEVQTEACSLHVADLLRPVTYLKRLLPGEVSRRWLSYQPTPSFEQNDLQLEVGLPGPQGDEQSYRTQFLLHGTSNPSPLPSQARIAQPVVEGRLGTFVIKNAQIGSIQEIQNGMHRSLMPCTFQRTVTMQIENASPQTEVTPSIWLVDADGRIYEPLPIDDRYSLEPRQVQTVSFTFPALLGARDRPVAVLFGDVSLDTKVRKTDPPQRLLLQLAEHQ